MHIEAFNVFSFLSAMDCTFQAETIAAALVSQYMIQRLMQEAGYCLYIYGLPMPGASSI